MWTVVKNGVIGCKICVKKGIIIQADDIGRHIGVPSPTPPPQHSLHFIGCKYLYLIRTGYGQPTSMVNKQTLQPRCPWDNLFCFLNSEQFQRSAGLLLFSLHLNVLGMHYIERRLIPVSSDRQVLHTVV